MQQEIKRCYTRDDRREALELLNELCLNQVRVKFNEEDCGYITSTKNSNFEWVNISEIEQYRDTLDPKLLNKGTISMYEIFYYTKDNTAKFCNI